MGKRGPKKAPTAVAQLHGDKTAGVDEPMPAPGQIVAPTNLSDGARGVWERLAPDLIHTNVLTPWDVDEFAAFCDAVERRDRAAAHLDADGEVIESPVFDRNGKPTGTRIVLSPWWQVWKGANEAMLRFGARFGLSPADRADLKVGHGRGANPKERFFTT
jgi:P27 family predicted phage terminase small subunit